MASTKKKINSRERSRRKELKKEKIRYELRRKVKKSIKKQINDLFSDISKISIPISLNDLQERKKALFQLYKTLDSKESKGLITKGRVKRLKSKYTIKFNKSFLNQQGNNLKK